MRKSVTPPIPEPIVNSVPLWMQSDSRVFQASNTFVHACVDATMAMHALSAKIKELEKSIRQIRKISAKPKTPVRAAAPRSAAKKAP